MIRVGSDHAACSQASTLAVADFDAATAVNDLESALNAADDMKADRYRSVECHRTVATAVDLIDFTVAESIGWVSI
ncbi:hypothetical protein GCM10027022_05730 [Alpinimonas psychrophila]